MREADRPSVAETAQNHKVSEQTIYGWRKALGDLLPAHVMRFKPPEAPNPKLKKLLAERGLHIDLLNEINRRKW